MKTLIINGQSFNSLGGFYQSLEPYRKIGECPWGHNLDSLDENVFCNFNYTGNKENDVNCIIWTDFQKSKSELIEMRANKTVIEIIEEIFNSNPTITFIKK